MISTQKKPNNDKLFTDNGLTLRCIIPIMLSVSFVEKRTIPFNITKTQNWIVDFKLLKEIVRSKQESLFTSSYQQLVWLGLSGCAHLYGCAVHEQEALCGDASHDNSPCPSSV